MRSLLNALLWAGVSLSVIACSNHHSNEPSAGVDQPPANDNGKPSETPPDELENIRLALASKYKEAFFNCRIWNQYGPSFNPRKNPNAEFRINLLERFPENKSLYLESYEDRDNQHLLVVFHLKSLALKDSTVQTVNRKTFELKNSPVVTFSYSGQANYLVLDGKFSTWKFGDPTYGKTEPSYENIPLTVFNDHTGILENMSYRFFKVQCSVEAEANPGFEDDYKEVSRDRNRRD